MKYVVEIPARLGSKRVPRKNLREICGKPMVAYAIEAAVAAERIDEVYVNSESDLIGEVAERHGARFYRRPVELSRDEVVSDEFNADFLRNVPCDALVMVNPVSPLVEASDIDGAVERFEQTGCDSLISVREERLHAFFRDEPLNFEPDGLLPMTQNIEPVRVCAWTVCVWRKETFLESFETKGHAVFSGRVDFFPIDPLKSLKISYEPEFLMAERLIAARREAA